MVTLFTQKENGDLKYIAEVEDTESPVEAVEAVEEDNPRLKADAFLALVGDLDHGGVLVSVSKQEKVVSGWSTNGVVEVDDEDEAPAPKRRGRPPGSGKKRGPGRPKGSGKKTASKPAASGGKRGRQATLTEDVLEEALERINEGGETVKAVAESLGVSSSGYLAKKIRETFGDDSLQVTRGRPAAAPAEAAPKKRGPGRPKGTTTKKRGPGRPKGSTNKTKAAAPAKRGPGRPKGSTNKSSAKRGPGRPKGSKNRKSPFAAKADEE